MPRFANLSRSIFELAQLLPLEPGGLIQFARTPAVRRQVEIYINSSVVFPLSLSWRYHFKCRLRIGQVFFI
jgi:hypothetical protein